MSLPKDVSPTERARAIIEMWRGKDDEISRLHALLCLDHPFDYNDPVAQMWRQNVDRLLIAERIDELTEKIVQRTKGAL